MENKPKGILKKQIMFLNIVLKDLFCIGNKIKTE